MFAISALLVSISATNFAYAGDSSNTIRDDTEKIEEDKEELTEEQKEKIEQEKEHKKELREEYRIKLEAKKMIFVDYKKELKEKFSALKNEYREKYAQLRISIITDMDEDEKIESEIKRNELRLLNHEFRENLKNLKLESKQHFDEFKSQLSDEKTDRKSKIQDRINEIKEKYKNKIIEHDHPSTSDLDNYSNDYESKKIEICHIPPGNSDNAHTLSISANGVRGHLAHGDYMEKCETSEDETSEDETDDVKEIDIKVEIEDGIAKIVVKIGDEEQEFELEETDRDLIIQYILDNTNLTIEEIETYIEFEEGQDIHVELEEDLGISQNVP